MKRLVFDLDGTLTHDDPNLTYDLKRPNHEIIKRMRVYKELGFEIVIMTSRNMKTFNNSIGLINAKTLPVVIEWLNKNQVPFDEIHIGKPWCGAEGFYIDDKAIRPAEFLNLSYDEISRIISVGNNEGA